MDYQDKNIACVDCKKEFVHTAGDQEIFAQKGYAFEPKRCPDCRKARKERGERQPGYTGPGGIGPVDRGGWGGGGGGGGGERRGGYGGGGGERRGGGGGGYGGPRREGGGGGRGFGGGGGGGFGGPRPSFDAVCAACGQKTTVPFEPTQGRDVYCRDCFQKRRNG
jgi:CxxC-x17-CxxC domain-containing protein